MKCADASPSASRTTPHRGATWGEWPHGDALPALPPSAVGLLEHSDAWRSAALAPTLSCQIPSRELVPIAPDQQCLAAVTVRTLALWIVNIAGVDIAQPGL